MSTVNRTHWLVKDYPVRKRLRVVKAARELHLKVSAVVEEAMDEWLRGNSPKAKTGPGRFTRGD